MPLTSQKKAIKKYDLSGASLLNQKMAIGTKHSPIATIEIRRFRTGKSPVFKGKSLDYNSVETAHFSIGIITWFYTQIT